MPVLRLLLRKSQSTRHWPIFSLNGFSAAGTTSNAEAIKVNNTLTDLNLSHDDIGDAGATSIAEAIKVNKTLTN